MKKVLIGMILLFSQFAITAQDLDEKQKQLDEINQQINKQEELIQLTEEQKRQKQQDLQNTEKKKKESESKVKKLLSTEKQHKKTLDSTLEEIKSTSSYLQDLLNLCETEVNNLVLAHYQSQLFPEKKLECKFLASMVDMTSRKIFKVDSEWNSLQKKKKSANKQYENIIWSRIVADKKRKEYSNAIASIQTNIQQLDKERAKALTRKNELEQNAIALDNLIKKLQTEIIEEDFSYKFSTAKLIWPVKGKVFKPFGEQYNAEYKVSTMNDGIDISVETGSDIRCVEDGEVAFAEWYNGAGKLIIIDHKNGFHTLYSHIGTLLVSKGDQVNKNQVIALSGQTGSAQIPSMHFEIRRRGVPVDPMQYLE